MTFLSPGHACAISIEPLETRRLLGADSFVDLVAKIGRSDLPATAISGDGTILTLQAAVKNGGNTAVNRRAALSAQVLAVPVSGGAGVVLGNFRLKNVNGLRPGKTAKQTVTVQLPVGLPTDQYRLAFSVDRRNVVDEPYDPDGRPLTRANNVALTGRKTPIDVTQGFFDVAVKVGANNLPAEAVSGETVAGTVGLRLINRGNIPLPPGQRLRVSLLTRPAGGEAATTLAELPALDVSRLRPGASRRIAAEIDEVVTLSAGGYRLSALADSRDALPEMDESNESPAGALAVVAPFVDVSVRVDGSALPATVTAGAPMSVAIIVRNNGNVAIPKGKRVALGVFSNRIERGILTFEYRGPYKQLLGSFPKVNIGDLGPGEERRIGVKVRFSNSDNVEVGQRKGFPYSISAEIDTANQLAEADELNNGASPGRLHAGTDAIAFSTTDQGMFGQGDAILDSGKHFVGTTWNTTKNLFNFDLGVSDAQVYASTRGKVGVDFQAKLDTGSVDVSYNNAVNLEVNEVARHTYSIKGKLAGSATGSLATRSPSIDVSSNLIFDVEATVGVRGFAPFAGNYDESLKVIDTNGATVNLLTLTNRQFSVLGDDIAVAEPGEDLSFTADLGFNPVLRAFQPELAGAKKKPDKPHGKNPLEEAIEFSAGDVTVYIPNVRLQEDEYAGAYLQSISASGQADLMKLDIDADFLAVTGALFASGVPTPGALGATFGVDGLFELALDIVDFDVGPVVSVRQDFNFVALPKVTYAFNHPVGIINPNRPQDPPSQFVTAFTTDVGVPFDFYFEGEGLEISTTYQANGMLRNITDLIAAPQYNLDVLRVGGEVLGLDLGSAQVINRQDRGQAIRLATLFNDTFELEGFAPVAGQTFALDLAGGSSIVNLV